MKLSELYQIFRKNYSISTDTRSIKQGDLFFALKGDNFDGNKYAKNALEKGANLCIVDNDEYKINDKCIVVNNVLETLQKLANYHLNQINIKTIAITGSNGKTTTKEIITSVLSQQYKVKSTTGNLNNHIGVPLTVLSFSKDLDFGIVEMGANHRGEIKTLAEIVNPAFGIITNVGTAHIEGFGSYDGVLSTKIELYENLVNNRGTAFIHIKNTELIKKSNELKLNTITFGDNENSIVTGEIESNTPFLNINIHTPGKNDFTQIKTNLIGNYNFENILAGVCIGKYFGIGNTLIKKAIEGYIPSNMRSQYKETQSNKLIIDAYNANPSSMQAAIVNLSSLHFPNKIAILGDMMELGETSQKEHQKIVDLLHKNNVSKAFLVGQHFQETECDYLKFPSTDELINFINKNKIHNSLILVKGSRKTAMEKIIDYL